MTPEQQIEFERAVEKRASKMSIEQLEAELVKLPASPPMTDEDFLTRAAFMRRHIELVAAGKPDPRAPKPVDPASLLDVNHPAGGTLRMSWPEFWSKCFQNVNGVVRAQIHNQGPSAGEWLAANPALTARLPKAEPPPPPQPYQE
jgi:hypothetical protein